MTNRNRDEDWVEEGREFTEEELEQLFREAEEEEPAPRPFISTPRFRKWVLMFVALVLVVQVLAFWPQIFSLDAIRFLSVSARLSQSEDIQAYKESVVVIRSDDSKGTGFIVSEDGLIVTNRHVVDEASQLTVSLHNGDRYTAQVVSVRQDVDLALLDIETDVTSEQPALPVLPLADAYYGAADIPVYIIGNPLFFSGIANEGETLGLTANESPPMMVLAAPVYKGNSGSPVITENGEVIGVVYATSAIYVDGEKKDIGLAVPVNWVHELLNEGEKP